MATTRLPITFNATLAGAVRRRNADALRRLRRHALSCGMSEQEFVSRACANDAITEAALDELLAADQAPYSHFLAIDKHYWARDTSRDCALAMLRRQGGKPERAVVVRCQADARVDEHGRVYGFHSDDRPLLKAWAEQQGLQFCDGP